MKNEVATWITRNQTLLSRYKKKYVAITDRIIASGDHLNEVDLIAKKQDDDYVLYYVPKTINSLKILPIHVKTLTVHEWQPLYPIELTGLSSQVFVGEALIDSGADISCLPNRLGADIGFETYPQEILLQATGVGGSIDYYQREAVIAIDGHKMRVPVAWLQDDGEIELIIGRAVIFDFFDINFRQSIEKIEFKRVESTMKKTESI